MDNYVEQHAQVVEDLLAKVELYPRSKFEWKNYTSTKFQACIERVILVTDMSHLSLLSRLHVVSKYNSEPCYCYKYFASFIFSKHPLNSQKTKTHFNQIDILEDTKMSCSDVGFSDSDSDIVTAYMRDTSLYWSLTFHNI